MGHTGPVAALATTLSATYYAVFHGLSGFLPDDAATPQQVTTGHSLDEVLLHKGVASAASDLNAANAPKGIAAESDDPVVAVFQGCRRMGEFVYDVGAEVVDAGLSEVWPWPVDHGAGAASALVNTKELWAMVEDTVVPLIDLVPAEMWTGAAAALSVPIDRCKPLETAIEAALRGFLERNPRHAAVVGQLSGGDVLLRLFGFLGATMALGFGGLWLSFAGLRCLTCPCRYALRRGQEPASGSRRKRSSADAVDKLSSDKKLAARRSSVTSRQVYNTATPMGRRPNRRESTGSANGLGFS